MTHLLAWRDSEDWDRERHENFAEDARRKRCAYCAMGAPTFRDTDGMICHRVASNQAVECGNDPSLATNI